MILAETIHVAGKPVGRLMVNTNSHEIAFQAAEAISLLPDQEWASVDELRAAVIAAYSKPEKEESPGGDTEAFSFFGKNTNQTTTGDLTDERHYTRTTPKADSGLV